MSSRTIGPCSSVGSDSIVRTGDVFEVPPGHVAYVVGDDAWTSIDFAGRRQFARSPRDASESSAVTATSSSAPDQGHLAM
jgi:hypothetical protein